MGSGFQWPMSCDRVLSRVPILIQTTTHLRISQLFQRKKQLLTCKTIIIVPLPAKRLTFQPRWWILNLSKSLTLVCTHDRKKKKSVKDLINKHVMHGSITLELQDELGIFLLQVILGFVHQMAYWYFLKGNIGRMLWWDDVSRSLKANKRTIFMCFPLLFPKYFHIYPSLNFCG